MFTSSPNAPTSPTPPEFFVAGDAELFKNFLLYRNLPRQRNEYIVQRASIAVWNDEEHVIANRRLYQEKIRPRHPHFATGI